MRLSEPRIPPLQDEQASEEQRELLEAAARGRPPLNIQRTIAQYPALARARLSFTRHIMGESSLPPRERELLILRTGWNCFSEYEFAQHSRFGRAEGITDLELARITRGAEMDDWEPFDAALIRAADELHDDAFISDDTWAALSERYSLRQLMDVIFTVGQYHIVCMALNSFGVQFEPETTERFPT